MQTNKGGDWEVHSLHNLHKENNKQTNKFLFLKQAFDEHKITFKYKSLKTRKSSNPKHKFKVSY